MSLRSDSARSAMSSLEQKHGSKEARFHDLPNFVLAKIEGTLLFPNL